MKMGQFGLVFDQTIVQSTMFDLVDINIEKKVQTDHWLIVWTV